MKLACVGVGSAGGRIVAAIRRQEKETGLTVTDGHVLVYDTDREALAELDGLPSESRVPVGDTFEAVEGEGVNGNPELAAEVARIDDHEIHRSFDDIPVEEDLDGILVVGGLGGATGSGTGAVIIDMCRELFEEPVYAVAVLPHPEEDRSRAVTAARGLQSYVRLADNSIVFDNGRWVESPGEADYGTANDELAARIVQLLALGDFDGAVAEARVDRTDIIRTLSTGGVSTIGMASITLDWGWRRWVRWVPGLNLTPTNGTNEALRIKNLVRRAVDSHLTVDCEISSAERGLIVLSGPPTALSRKGFESARYWLEEEADTVEIIAGDEPQPNSDTVTATVLLSNVTEVQPIETLKATATATVDAPDA